MPLRSLTPRPRSHPVQTRLLATAFSLLCFAAALLAGALAGNSGGTVLGRGLTVLFVAYVVGRALEWAAELALTAASDASAAVEAVAADAVAAALADEDLAEVTEAGPRTLSMGNAGLPADAHADADVMRAA